MRRSKRKAYVMALMVVLAMFTTPAVALADTWCVSDPSAPGGDVDGDATQRCPGPTEQQAEDATVNYARVSGYTVSIDSGAYSLSCTGGVDGILYSCRFEIPGLVLIVCDYGDGPDSMVVCYTMTP